MKKKIIISSILISAALFGFIFIKIAKLDLRKEPKLVSKDIMLNIK